MTILNRCVSERGIRIVKLNEDEISRLIGVNGPVILSVKEETISDAIECVYTQNYSQAISWIKNEQSKENKTYQGFIIGEYVLYLRPTYNGEIISEEKMARKMVSLAERRDRENKRSWNQVNEMIEETKELDSQSGFFPK